MSVCTRACLFEGQYAACAVSSEGPGGLQRGELTLTCFYGSRNDGVHARDVTADGGFGG